MSLQLVSQGLTDAVIFTAEGGEMVQAADILYKKSILVERGSFRPVTYATNDMLNGARSVFLKQSGCSDEDPGGFDGNDAGESAGRRAIEPRRFPGGAWISWGALGRTVIISKFGEYFRLASYLSALHEPDDRIGHGRSQPPGNLRRKYYLNLEGGILEALGRMFKSGLKLYVIR